MMRLTVWLYVVCVLALPMVLVAEDGIFAEAKEAQLWQWLLDRSGRKPHIERDGKGTVKWVGFYDEEKKKGDFYSGSLTFEAGRVVKMTFNNANFTNEDLKQMAGFTQLRVITAWHNGWDKQKDSDKSVYSGAGLIHLKGSRVESVNFGGSWFNDEGVRAAVGVPSLRELIIYHTRVTDAGLAALAKDDHIRLLRGGPQYSMKITGAALASVASMKAIEDVEFNETILTWEGGLKHLVALKGRLKRFACNQGLIAPEDLEKLRAALPDTKIEYVEAESKFIDQMKRHASKP